MSYFYILLDSLAFFPEGPVSNLLFLELQILAAHFLDQLSLHLEKLRGKIHINLLWVGESSGQSVLCSFWQIARSSMTDGEV